MAKPDLEEIMTVADPLLSDNFLLNFPTLPVGDIGRALAIQCRTATKPGMTMEEVEIALFGHVVKHVGRNTTTHEMTIEYVETRTGQILKILEDWCNYARHIKTQHGHFKSEYARTAKLQLFDQKGTEVLAYNIIGCWPSAVPDVQLDGQASNLIAVSTTYKFDYVERITPAELAKA